MVANFTLREWDSQFFNRKIFMLEPAAFEISNSDWPENSLMTAKVGSSDYSCFDVLARYNFDFIEGELVFKKQLAETSPPKGLSAYLATESSLDELNLIVRDLYANSRFREPWFTSIERNSFYQMWVENAVLSKFDDFCLVLRSENAISGFVTARIRERVATIGLIGVAKSFQGQGVGKKLLQLVEDYCLVEKAKSIVVATQTSNIAAANLYSKAGFTIADISYWFYKQV